jgi:hypothetical protein
MNVLRSDHDLDLDDKRDARIMATLVESPGAGFRVLGSGFRMLRVGRGCRVIYIVIARV